METSTKTPIGEKMRDAYQSFFQSEHDPELIWSILIWLFVSGVVIATILAISTYRWSTKVGELTQLKPERTAGISRDEINQVVDLYQKKNAKFEELRNGKTIDIPGIIQTQGRISTPVEQEKIQSVN
jgi:hypothetical protein